MNATPTPPPAGGPAAPQTEGVYAKKQLGSRLGVIRWSHRRRFEVAVEKSAPLRGLKILDYGCGDGTYLERLMTSPSAPAEAVGADIDPRLVADNARRLAGVPHLRFIPQDAVESPEFAGVFDGVVCMEVFEHIVDRPAYLDLLQRLLKPGGRLLLSVPVETGLPLLFKQAVRRVAGWLRVGDYHTTLPYTWGELFRGVFASAAQHIPRHLHREEGVKPYHCHKGFNWRTLRNEIAERFDLISVSASPVEWLPPSLGSQVWFEAKKRG